ncbi:MAG: AAA family ATPase, partial [Bosea sp. (in: a-proteobacteria)]|nr:AAA family ATPase [Bosea sp. (in: a-proteobacteria)]
MNAGEDQGSVSASAVEDVVAPLPRVTLQAFCETPGVAATMQAAIADRRMDKAHARIHMGGPAAAVEAFRAAPTPNIIVLETVADAGSLIGHLDTLSESCDAGTKVIVIGHVNDVQLYRDLIRRGVSEYLIAPLGTLDVLKTLSELYVAPGARNLGRMIAVMGAKGGVGSSTVSHNVAWAIARNLDASTVIVDLDIAYGTAGLDFNQDPPQGIAEAVFAPERLDANMLDRLLSRCSDNLALLAAPAMLDRTLDLPEDAFEQLFDLLRATVPCVVLDVPHVWSGWTRRALISADEIVVVAGPELASLRNAKKIGRA